MAFTAQELQAGFHIGECLIEPRQNRILRRDAEARVEPRVMDVLVSLASRAGEVVSRETLNQEVWRDVVVTDQAVTNCISELRHHLGDDRSTNRIIETIPKRGYRLAAPVRLVSVEPAAAPAPVISSPPASRKRWFIAAGFLVAAALALVGAGWWRSAANHGITSVAVVRFVNEAGDGKLDYLALALSDETATLLTQARDLAVRPLGFVGGDDPLAAARERHVDHVVTGRYYLEEDSRLSLAIEAQNARQERVIWRTHITVPAGDLIAMRARIAEGVREGLLPALGTAASIQGTTPAHAEAYRLYLRSLELPQQPKPTERAIEMLERAVDLEPQFAPAWNALGIRYYAYGTWGEGGAAARAQSLAAHRRALELDPDLTEAARQIINHQTETGELAAAYGEARRLLDREGPGPETHFALAYVYRFGGMLDEAQRHCELALDRDPQDPRLRSCAYSYLYAGKLSRVPHFLKLDEGAFFVQWGTVLYHLRLDDRAAALHVTRQTAAEPTRGLMEPCLEGARGAALDDPARAFVQHWERSGDPEAAYALAPMLLYCGRTPDALRFLERAVDMGFCSFPAVDQDLIWTNLRGDPEFQRIRAKGRNCHERFRRAVEAYDASNQSRGPGR
jgi:DNA-binding winged helix-turn-helix (wHTH) protein/tetratricopeptide (TPR) repeat protein